MLMQISESKVFDRVSGEVAEFYRQEGFCHLRTQDQSFQRSVDDCYAYYAASALDSNTAFRNAAGIPRHVVDVFRDPRSPAFAIYRSEFMQALVASLYSANTCLIFTHAKLSFKTPGAQVNWFPHQDNGYKFGSDIRLGFAIFVCLEDMDASNGCLQVFPKSHALGTLPHERVIEDQSTGDNQLRIRSVPAQLRSLPIVAKKGDVIAFSCNTIHQSGSSTTASKRLALIAEVEEYTPRKLDDYGKAPLTARGVYAKSDEWLMRAKSFTSPYTIWRIVKKSKPLALFIRKLRY